jgi:hypothetical protein
MSKFISKILLFALSLLIIINIYSQDLFNSVLHSIDSYIIQIPRTILFTPTYTKFFRQDVLGVTVKKIVVLMMFQVPKYRSKITMVMYIFLEIPIQMVILIG